MTAAILFLAICLVFPCINLYSESFRTTVDGVLEVNPGRTSEGPVSIGINSSFFITLGPEARFLSGIELEITAPQAWLRYGGSLVMIMYNNLNQPASIGIADLVGGRIAFEALPSRLRIVYHIPIRANHGLRTTTSVTVPTGITAPDTFPLLFRLMPVDKGLSSEFDDLRFNVTARPILSDEGAIRLVPRYPPQLRNRPFTVLINDVVVTNINELIMLREGEHHLVILSEDYRNESRRFIVERGRITDLIIDLHDPTPMLIFEGPQNAEVYLNNSLVRSRDPVPVEPGTHEIRFLLGDYTVIRTINVQRGKTYRISLEVDLTISEED